MVTPNIRTLRMAHLREREDRAADVRRHLRGSARRPADVLLVALVRDHRIDEQATEEAAEPPALFGFTGALARLLGPVLRLRQVGIDELLAHGRIREDFLTSRLADRVLRADVVRDVERAPVRTLLAE